MKRKNICGNSPYHKYLTGERAGERSAFLLSLMVEQGIGQEQDCQECLKNGADTHNYVAGHWPGDLFPVWIR
jgi:hypothetical protein